MPAPAMARSQQVLMMVLTDMEESHSNGLVYVLLALLVATAQALGPPWREFFLGSTI